MIKKHPFDKNKYEQTILKNNIRLTTISRNDLDKASIAISVHVGAFKDPIEYQGLAHFLEHLLFMGSEKYPEENYFSDFLSQHNGYYNAYTSSEKTVYFLEIDRAYLFKACDILSQFFISPLFNEDSISREIKAVNSEFLNRKNNDFIRMDHIYNILCNKTAPNNKFSCGNFDSLNKPNLREEVIKFWKKYYKQIDLIIYGREDFETLKSFAKKTFGLIKDLKEPFENKQENYKKIKSLKLFEKPFFIEIEPFKEKKSLIILIKLPSAHKLPYNQYEYFIYFLGKTEQGSFINILKKKGLIYNCEIDIEKNSFYSNLELEFNLTSKGEENIKDILNLFIELDFSYYLHYKDLLDFQYKLWEMPNSTDHCLEIINMVHLVPFNDLFEHKRIFNFNENIFNYIKNDIKDINNWCVFHMKKINGKKTKEELYEIFYNKNNLIDFIEEKYLIATKFSNDFNIPINKGIINRYDYNNNYKLLLLNSDKYSSNDVVIIFLKSYDFLNNEFRTKNFIEIFEENCTKIIERKDTSIDFIIKEYGIQIEINSKDLEEAINILINKRMGLSIKTINCLNKDINSYNEMIKEKLYEKIKSLEKQPPYQIMISLLKKYLFKQKSNEELLEDLKNIKNMPIIPEEMEIFFSANINETKCKELSEKIFNSFDFSNIETPNLFLNEDKISKTLISLIENSTHLEYKSKDTKNNAFGIFLRIKDGILNNLKINLILNYSNEQFFDQLRTKDQLGYIVYNRIFTFNKNTFFGFVVQSEVECEILYQKVKSFILNLPISFPEDKFSIIKESYENLLNEELVNKKEFTDHYFNLWQMGYDPLEFKNESLKYLKEINFSDINFDEIFDASVCVKIFKENIN